MVRGEVKCGNIITYHGGRAEVRGGGFMRIISGKFKGIRLKHLGAHCAIRPIKDSQKEALFNVLTHNSRCWYHGNPAYLGNNVLDLFAGTGSLGIEALSRGARHVTFVDISSLSHGIIGDNLNLIRLGNGENGQGVTGQGHGSLITGQVWQYRKNVLHMGSPVHRYHLVFMDPPYGHSVLHGTLCRLHKRAWLSHRSVCVLKINSREDVEVPEQFQVITEKRTRDENIMFLRYFQC